ncbi:hypothetical protein B0T16DRAFT_421636 [Cercophora newfieldiana]|uniref:Small ribosomal subunit protein bS18m n=1 Tax=Cercophora newfieldiana TaxID=92897 RepID=A0AA39XS33_9PEZI|nr:hypothetical protein B0T16DRAFT_421636 [Cercophora newfieldiana]
MASRTWFSTALRHCQSTLRQTLQKQPQSTPFSTSAPALSLKDHSSPSSHLIDLSQRSTKRGDVRNLLNDSAAYSREKLKRQSTEKDLAATSQTDAYMQYMPRSWRKGDVYAPKDLSHVEARRWKLFKTPRVDIVDLMGFNPVDNYRNFAMIAEHITAHGRIEAGRATGLRPVNQRKMAKAIRRAIGMGLHPSVHLHPEIILNRTKYIPHAILPTTQLPVAAKSSRFSRTRFSS